MGELTRAQARAATAQRLDPHDSQVLALCRLLEQEIEEKRLKEELRKVMVSAREHLAARDYEEAFVLLDKAGTIAPELPENGYCPGRCAYPADQTPLSYSRAARCSWADTITLRNSYFEPFLLSLLL